MPLDNWITQEVFDKHLKSTGAHGACEISAYSDNVAKDRPRHIGKLNNLDDVKKLFDGYDTGIKYMDERLVYC